VSDLVPVTFSVMRPPCLNDPPTTTTLAPIRASIERQYEALGGIELHVVPTDVKGEFRVFGLFPKSFAEARSY
jgi:hypothetical protein